LVFAILFNRLNGIERLMGITVCFYAISDIVAFIVGKIGYSNMYFYNVLLIPQVILVVICLIYHLKNAKVKNILRLTTFIVLILHVLNIYFGQGKLKFCTMTYLPACAFMAATAYICLRDNFENTDYAPFSFYTSWFAIATLIDNAGAMPVNASLSWPGLYSHNSVYFLLDFVQALYISWFIINITGLLWTKTTLRSVLRLR
jgi:hypothetical protein